VVPIAARGSAEALGERCPCERVGNHIQPRRAPGVFELFRSDVSESGTTAVARTQKTASATIISGANCHDFLAQLVATARWFGSNLHVTLDGLFRVFRTVDELAGVFPGSGDSNFSISR
jgi:hypothetical protein